MIVDDDDAVLASLEFLLQAAGYDVIAYASPADFFLGDAARSTAEQPTCLVVDQQMPEMTGLELIASLYRAGRMIPALLISSAPTPAIHAQAADLGVAFCPKPLNEEDLIRFVAAHTRPAKT